MLCHKIITNLLAAAVLALSGVSAVHAAEVQPALSDEPSLFERYRSGAKDLILKGLELTGIKYRRGAQTLIVDSTAAASFNWSSRTRSACCCRVPPRNRVKSVT